jgi:hypothetical protein
VRPPLVALETFGLQLWPLLLFAYLLCFALPMVTLYLTVATGTARVLGNDVRPFPPRWVLRLAWLLMLPLALILSLPQRALRRGGRATSENDANDARKLARKKSGGAR